MYMHIIPTYDVIFHCKPQILNPNSPAPEMGEGTAWQGAYEEQELEGRLRVSEGELKSLLKVLMFNNLESVTFIKEPR